MLLYFKGKKEVVFIDKWMKTEREVDFLFENYLEVPRGRQKEEKTVGETGPTE